MWLGRALGEKAGHASFLTAFPWPSRRALNSKPVQLNPHNAPPRRSGDFYTRHQRRCGGIDKARQIAASLRSRRRRAHELLGTSRGSEGLFGRRARIRQAIAADTTRPSLDDLAGFFARRKQFDDMESAVHSAQSFASRDKYAAVAFYDGAGVLIEAKADRPSLQTCSDVPG